MTTFTYLTAPDTRHHITPADVGLHFEHTDPIRPLTDDDLAQCGTCERVWCDTCTPTPAARCPFEYDHDEADDNPLNDYDDTMMSHRKALESIAARLDLDEYNDGAARDAETLRRIAAQVQS